jgi:hypothetical protein
VLRDRHLFEQVLADTGIVLRRLAAPVELAQETDHPGIGFALARVQRLNQPVRRPAPHDDLFERRDVLRA